MITLELTRAEAIAALSAISGAYNECSQRLYESRDKGDSNGIMYWKARRENFGKTADQLNEKLEELTCRLRQEGKIKWWKGAEKIAPQNHKKSIDKAYKVRYNRYIIN